MEDLTPRTPLDERLRAEGLAPLGAEMLDYARALGELGAATAGMAARYDAIRAAYGRGRPDRRPASAASGLSGRSAAAHLG